MEEQANNSGRLIAGKALEQCDHVLDTSGLNCPLPLLRLKRALVGMESGNIIKVLATDAASVLDFGVFSDQTGHKILDQHEEKGIFYYLIKKK